MAHDGTALAVELLENDTTPTGGIDPMEIRWGIQCSERSKYLDGQWVRKPIIPYATWFPISRFATRKEFHTIDDGPDVPRDIAIVRTAQESHTYLEDALAGKDEFGKVVQGKKNCGLQIDFYSETDAGKMAVISKTLLPSLPEIRDICQSNNLPCPITQVCEGQDDIDFGERETCPTCWLKWIASPACAAYIQIVARDGRYVHDVNDPNNERQVVPTIVDLEKARSITVLSLQTGIIALQTTWASFIGEIDKGERKNFDEAGYQQSIRKDIHAIAPQDRNLAIVRQYAQTANQGSGNNNDILEALARSSMETNALLKQVLSNGKPLTETLHITNDTPTIAESPAREPDLTPAQLRMQHAREAKAAKTQEN